MKVSELAKSSNAALLVVDQQYDFEPGGALAVKDGDKIAEPISELMKIFRNVILTQDSHPSGHISFASSYVGKKPFEILTATEVERGEVKSKFSKEVLLHYLSKTPQHQQVLWPDHCVRGTSGWKLDSKLPFERAFMILEKGTRLGGDSYSAFFENDGTPTGLTKVLAEKNIDSLLIVGLAGDYCVLWSAEDAIREGFQVFFDQRLTAFVNFPEGSHERALARLNALGVRPLDP